VLPGVGVILLLGVATAVPLVAVLVHPDAGDLRVEQGAGDALLDLPGCGVALTHQAVGTGLRDQHRATAGSRDETVDIGAQQAPVPGLGVEDVPADDVEARQLAALRGGVPLHSIRLAVSDGSLPAHGP